MLHFLLTAVLATTDLAGTVFVDRNGNGVRDPGEPGVAGAAVSDQVDVVTTDRNGVFRIADSRGFGVVFVSVPAGYRSVGPFWRPAAGPLAFALAPVPASADLVFVHASDTHISAASVARTRRFGRWWTPSGRTS